MARDKDGRLIPRNAQSQQAFDMSLARIKRNWNLDALSAIPDIDGLRPAHIDTVTVDFVRYLGYISHYEKDVKVVQASMIDEQNRRVESKKIIEEKDKLLKLSDLKNIHERYKRDLVKTPKDPDGESLQDDDTEGRRTETGHTELPGGETDDSTLSILNSEDFRSLEGSSGRSSTTIHSTVYVEQPDQSEFYSLREKRPRSPDANDPQAVTKRVKILDELYHACQQPQENEKLSWAPKELARPSSRTPKHDRTLTPIEQAASKSAGFDERLARAKTLADQVGLLDRQPVEGLPDVGYRSNSYDYITPSTPSVSSLSDGPARPLIAQSFPENPTQPKDPSHHMLDKMTTNFTDNLFFLHGVLRTFADTGSGRASGEALDLAAGGVLEALKIFRRRVELIIEGDITQPFLVEQQTAPVIQGNSSGSSDTPSEEKRHTAVTVETTTKNDQGSISEPGQPTEHNPQRSYSPEAADLETAMLQDFPELRPRRMNHDQNTKITDTEAVPQRSTELEKDFIDPFEELLRNPWSTDAIEAVKKRGADVGGM